MKRIKYAVCWIACLAITVHLEVHAQNIEADSLRQVKLKNLVVTANKLQRSNNLYQYTKAELDNLISPLGEVDVLKYINTLPGVSSGFEGGSAHYVRGGNNGNNRLLLDGVPVYGASHLFGLLSVFHPDIIDHVDYTCGGMNAEYGNYLSSLINIHTSSKVKKRNKAISISPFLISGSYHGYLDKQKRFSIHAAARYALLNAEYQLISNIANEETTLKPDIEDAFVKLNYASDVDNLSISTYLSNDYLKYSDIGQYEINWQNTLAYMVYTHDFSNKAHFKSTLYYSNFKNYQVQGTGELDSNDESHITSTTQLNANIVEYGIKGNLTYNLKNSTLTTGIDYTTNKYNPDKRRYMTDHNDTLQNNSSYRSSTLSTYIDYTLECSKHIVKAGIRGNWYKNKDCNQINADLHLSYKYLINNQFGLNASFDYCNQFYHVIEGLPIGWSLDLTLPAQEDKMQAENSIQYYLGGHYNHNNISLSMGGYYKKMIHLQSYVTPSHLFFMNNADFDSDIVDGTGNSYGLECRGEIKKKKYALSLSYTLSKTTRQYDAINDGKTYPFKFDRLHNLNVSGGYVIKQSKYKKHTIHGTFAYSSGHRMTIAYGIYQGVTAKYWSQRDGGLVYPDTYFENMKSRQLMCDKNGFKLPNYIRLDLGYSIYSKHKHYASKWTFGVYNVLNTQNPYLIFYEEDKWKQLSILPILPSIRYTIEF